jgi:hypothetical protein
MYRCHQLLPVLLPGSERGRDHASFALFVLIGASGCLALCRVLLSALAVIMNICRQLQLQLFTAALGGLPPSRHPVSRTQPPPALPTNAPQ